MKNSEVTAKDLVQLGQECTRHARPITSPQLETFRQRPEGPILPAECISVVRVRSRFPLGIEAMEIGPDQRLWAIVRRQDRVLEAWVDGVSAFTIGQPTGPDCRLESPQIEGFFDHKTPLVRVSHCLVRTDVDEVYDSEVGFFRGGEPLDAVIPRFHNTQAVVLVHVTPDGSLTWADSRTHEVRCLGPDGIVHIRFLWTAGNPTGLAVGWNGLTALSVLDQGSVSLTIDLSGKEYPNPLAPSGHVFGIDKDWLLLYEVAKDGYQALITTVPLVDGQPATLPPKEVERQPWNGPFGQEFQLTIPMPAAYVGGLTHVGGRRFAYIGARPHQHLGWVMDRRVGPGFPYGLRTTRLYNAGANSWWYWGVIGEHLYQMELPYSV